MADVGEVRYKAVVDNSGIDTEIKKTEKGLGGLDDPIKKTSSKFSGLGKVGVTALKGIGTAFVGLASAAGAGVAAVAKMGIEYNAQMQSYQTAFTTMLGSAEKAQKLTDDLKEMAAATPLAMTDLADASQILLAFGSSAEELPDQLKRLGDVAQGDAQALGTMATAFGRIQSNGYASLEEINMMIDQGFNPLNIIAEQTGETMAEVRDRVSAGEVSFEELSNALQIATDEGGQFFNAMQNQSETFEGQMSTLEDNLSALAGTLTEDLFGSLAENTLPQVNAWVDELMTAAEEGGVEGAVEASGSILTEMITSLLNGAPQMIETATSLVQSFLGSIRDNGPEVVDGAIGVVMSLISGFIECLPDLIDTAATLVASLLAGIGDHLPEILEMGVRLVAAIIEGLITAIPRLVVGALDLISSIITAFGDVDWLQLGVNIVVGIIDGIKSRASSLMDSIRHMAANALEAAKDFFGIHSPSRVMREQVGHPIAEGMAEGMEDAPGIDTASKELSKRALSSLTADVNYNLPDVAGYTRALTADFGGSTYRASTAITVPLYLDGREVARATAWWTGEQLSWEEM